MAIFDGSTGTQRIGYLGGGIKVELGHLDLTDDITASYTIASTLSKLITLIGIAECSLGCVSGTMGKPVTNASLCSGLIEVSIGDISTGTDSAELAYIAFGW